MLTSRSDVRKLTALAVFIYFSSYLTRVSFTAILVEFIAAEGVAKPEAAVVTMALSLAYGIGQLFSGWAGDQLDPRKLIFWGLAASICMNILLPFTAPCIPLMAVVWAVNGIAQSFLWPPLVKILVCSLSAEDYGKVVPKISFGSGGGTIAVYLVSPLFIRFIGWRAVFFFCAAVAFSALIVWRIFSPKLLSGVSFDELKRKKEAQPSQADAPAGKAKKNPLLVLLPMLLAATVAAGMLREGINQWSPSILRESFALPTELSILTVAGLQVFHILCNLFTGRLLRKTGGKTLFTTFVFFALMTAALTPLVFFGTSSVYAALILLVLVAIPANSINFLQVSALPGHFAGPRVSLISGLLNFATYFGSALSAFLFSRLSERFGWTFTFGSWIAVSLAGTLISLAAWMILVLRAKKRKKAENR